MLFLFSVHRYIIALIIKELLRLTTPKLQLRRRLAKSVT
jgi:hypothetical protein